MEGVVGGFPKNVAARVSSPSLSIIPMAPNLGGTLFTLLEPQHQTNLMFPITINATITHVGFHKESWVESDLCFG